MAISRLNENTFDYSFKYQSGFVKHRAIQATQIIHASVKNQGSIPVEVSIASLAIPFQVSAAGMRALRHKKFVVKNLKAVGLSSLKDLSTNMSKLLDDKPKVNI